MRERVAQFLRVRVWKKRGERVMVTTFFHEARSSEWEQGEKRILNMEQLHYNIILRYSDNACMR